MREQPLEIVSTFLGAHVVPAEYRGTPGGPQRYVSLLMNRLIPEVAERKLAEFCDVFCDRGAFSRGAVGAGVGGGREARAGAAAARGAAFAHGRDAARGGDGAASCDHLEQVKAADIRALAKSKTVATLLPGCDFHLGLKQYAPARALIDAGAIVGLATDYNPGTSPTLSMPMVLSLACTQLRMTPAEAITAATINAAYSLRRDKEIGSIEVGKLADLAVFDVEDYREIPYYFGVNNCWMTMKKGEIVYRADGKYRHVTKLLASSHGNTCGVAESGKIHYHEHRRPGQTLRKPAQ